MKYSREMLLTDTPQFLLELEKQKNAKNQKSPEKKTVISSRFEKGLWDKLKEIFK